MPYRSASFQSSCPGIYNMPMSGDGRICRIRLEQGRITTQQLHILACLSANYGNGIIELTNRANVQLRGIGEEYTTCLVQALEAAGLAPQTPGADGVRNVMVNPTAGFDEQGDKRIVDLGSRISEKLQSTPRYSFLSPKFSILLDGGEGCAIVNHLSDIWLSLCDDGGHFAFGLASRPPLIQEKMGSVHDAWGKVAFDRAEQLVFALTDLLLEKQKISPKITRMKHWLTEEGKQALAQELRQNLPFMHCAGNFRRQMPKPYAHLGIHPQSCFEKENTVFYLGIQPPFGRLTPATAHFIADRVEEYKDCSSLRLTPWRSIIFPNCLEDQANELLQIFTQAGFVTDAGQILARIVCCAGAPSCQSAKSNVYSDAQFLAKKLRSSSFATIHLTGCAKSCAANEAQTLTLVATACGRYDLFQVTQLYGPNTKNAHMVMPPNPPVSSFGKRVACDLTIEQATRYIELLS